MLNTIRSLSDGYNIAASYFADLKATTDILQPLTSAPVSRLAQNLPQSRTALMSAPSY